MMRRWVVCPRSHPASPFFCDLFILALPCTYSVRWNSAIAMPSRAAPITATMPSERPTGTGQPFQVTEGSSTALAAGGMFR